MKVTFFSVLLTVTLLFTLLFTTQASHAETFRWVDESGKIRIGIKPPAKPVNVEKNNKESNTEIKKAPPVVARPVVPKTIIEHATPSTKTVEAPQTPAPVANPAPAPTITTPEIIAPIKKPVSTQPPKPVQKTSIEKPKPVKKKAPAKKPEKVTSVKKKVTEKKSADERNEEMCGVFTDYANNYKEKVRDCSPNLCDIYKRSLARYKKKQTSYCK